ncbi:hypothetical protein SAMN02746064_01557 [Alkalibacter saccharofermentans DSM 14828]|uniref:Uncharacterized protein n=1 Tax=Alkalibacter saccharofermentans DSM 14828 TaxID=1120975 RepID=A0A1M4XPS6_9FIRM|nr:hypothetical protein SAMN02746064_01557 [Alkalibacter saccharofermentans DSM 14828]
MKLKKMNLMTAAIFILLVFGLIAVPTQISANENEGVFNGLYLISGGDATLKNVDISILVNDKSSSRVNASYEVENTGEETIFLYMGMPLSNVNITEATYRFTPYVYNSRIVAGEMINHLIDGVALDYANWRTYSFEVPLRPGEIKTASISYTVENYYSEDGRLGFNIDLEHIKSWNSKPESIKVTASFNPRSVRIYNFDNRYAVNPTEMTPQYSLEWSFDETADFRDISFNYYPVDDKIKDELVKQRSSRIDAFLKEYENRDYAKAIEAGREYIQNSQPTEAHNLVYLLMADSYVQQREYNQVLAVYELIESTDLNFGELHKRIDNKMLINKITALENLKRYEEMYDLIMYEKLDPDLNYYLEQWLDESMARIPDSTLERIEEERKPPTAFEMFVRRFIDGNFTVILIAGGIIVALIVFLIYYIRKKKKKNFFF